MYANSFLWTVSLVILYICVPDTAQGARNKHKPPPPGQLTLSRKRTSAEVGRSYNITCRMPIVGSGSRCADNLTSADLLWFAPNGSLIPSSEGYRLRSLNGSLSCQPTRLTDTGKYTCRLINCSLSVEAEVLVYEMPSYTLSLSVVYSIDGILAIVAAVLCAMSVVETINSSRRAAAF